MLSRETHELILDMMDEYTWLSDQRIKMYKDFLDYTYRLEAQKARIEKKAMAEGLKLPPLDLISRQDNNNNDVCSLVKFA